MEKVSLHQVGTSVMDKTRDSISIPIEIVSWCLKKMDWKCCWRLFREMLPDVDLNLLNSDHGTPGLLRESVSLVSS